MLPTPLTSADCPDAQYASTAPPAMTRRSFLAAAASAAMISALPAAVNGVELGVCEDVSALDKTAAYGFDYLEPPAAAIAELDENAFQQLKAHVEASKIRCKSFNSFIRRPELRVVGEHVDRGLLISYLQPAMARCRELGGEVIVWGSAGSRNVPPGFSRQRAWEQIIDFLKLTGDLARAEQLVIGIEPLRRQESNIINTGREALDLVQRVQHSNIQMIIDYYHLREENEDPRILWTARKHIVHLHFANPAGRVWPKNPTEDPGYRAFFAMLKKIKYRGGLSIEGNGSLDRDATASLQFFRKELA